MEYRPKDYIKEYHAFHNAKSRCINKNLRNYDSYGGRGIMFKFISFQEFMDCVGTRPKGRYSIDRIDVDGNYESGNIRWATDKQQARNTRTNTIFTIDGISRPLSELAEIYKKPYKSVHRRIYRYGWSIEKSLKEPMRETGRLNKSGIKYLHFFGGQWVIDRRLNGERIIHKLKTKVEAVLKLKELSWIK